jgi:hypothetical protein
MLPFMPNVSSLLGMLRLLRLLRVLKLVKALPELRIIIEALISGFGSIFFVTIILFMFFYLYANIGLILFSGNDQTHFGNLQLALMSLFRAATMDDWTDIMSVQDCLDGPPLRSLYLFLSYLVSFFLATIHLSLSLSSSLVSLSLSTLMLWK